MDANDNAPPAAPITPPAAPAPSSRAPVVVAFVAIAAAAAAVGFAYNTQQRVKSLERELVQRQSQSQSEATEARLASRGAQDLARESAAKVALLEARVAEAAMQRSQLEELLQSVARSRDENVVSDVDAAVRVAMQQSAITGSAEPLLATLKQAEERLARYNQPKLERVRRAVQQDIERAKALGSADISTLALRLDEVVRGVDELPLLAVARDAQAPRPAAAAASVPPLPPDAPWRERAARWWRDTGGHVAQELRALVRVTRIDHADSMLVAPDQQFYVRENLKLRLLNARLALFARQFDIVQADLRDAQAALDRYFDRSSKRVLAASDTLRQVAAQARQTKLPRPDETLAALAAAASAK